MTKLSITVYQRPAAEPEVRIAIPVTVVKIAQKLIPRKVHDELMDQGIDINEIIAALDQLQDTGTIMEVETEDRLIIIALEGSPISLPE